MSKLQGKVHARQHLSPRVLVTNIYILVSLWFLHTWWEFFLMTVDFHSSSSAYREGDVCLEEVKKRQLPWAEVWIVLLDLSSHNYPPYLHVNGEAMLGTEMGDTHDSAW